MPNDPTHPKGLETYRRMKQLITELDGDVFAWAMSNDPAKYDNIPRGLRRLPSRRINFYYYEEPDKPEVEDG